MKKNDMSEGVSMYDIIIWFVRMLIPILIYRVYFVADGTGWFSSLKSSDSESTQTNRFFSGKQHFTICSDRPLYEIQEEHDVSAPSERAKGTPHQPLFTRESCLSHYLGSSKLSRVPVELFRCDNSPGTCPTSSKEITLKPEDEKQYLQSLVQFRALRSTGLNHASWEQWNEEAQRILKGAKLLRCTGIAVEVYDTMLSAGVLPDCDTFNLLVSTSVTLGELGTAKNFLTEMSNAGFIPPRNFLEVLSQGLNDSSLTVAPQHPFNKNAPEFIPSSCGERTRLYSMSTRE